ncbi:HEAT repeat domain-containing protein [Leptothrix discophora]|uniref:HEAT repeat domain-containing protein n=1 Tax=Leptothrix discophora TaxID=89 RepID=A0ABT9G1Y9_LEPDI|nr:HEAT repeat domain-containing protein [Leptothrix discophora]MDP4300435.1 HEAT repeat domain-containing protein [Leptothrix discophora]
MPLKKSGAATELHQVETRDYGRDFDGLVAQLRDPEPGVRRWAARDLASEPRAAVAVCARLAEEGDASVRVALFNSATQIGGAAIVQGMVRLLRSEDAGLRNGAIEVLAGLPDAVAPQVDALLRDPDSDVRIFSVNLLGDLRHPNVPQWLAQVLLHDEAVNVVGAALEVAAEVGTAGTLPALRAARERFAADAYISFSVDLAIERIEST